MFVLLVSKVVLIFDPLGGKPQAVLIFGAVLSLGPVLIFGTGVYTIRRRLGWILQVYMP
jgi:hypothetical protein